MTNQEIIAEISKIHRKFPRGAVAEAISRREEIIPELLRLLEHAQVNFEDYATRGENAGILTAIYLLAQFREKRAYPIIIGILSADITQIDAIFGVLLTEAMGRILASVCDGDVGLIHLLIENEELDEYVRSAGLDALVALVAQGINTREETMLYFLSLFEGKLERKPSMVWSSLVCSCLDIYAIEAERQIWRAYDDGLIDETDVDINDVINELKIGETLTLKKLSYDIHAKFIDNTTSELSRWLCLQEPEPKRTDWQEETWTPAPKPTGIKVGRNDLCPCGSGKKYKKCCLE